MLRKHASLEVLEAWRVPSGASIDRIRKAAHRVQFDYEPRPGYLYVRSRMISSRTNDNHDTFPADEIEKGYKSFLGKPVFVNHHNANHRRARGVIVAVALHRDRNPDGSPDTWAEGLHEIDAVRFPRLCKAIIAGKVNRTSMGVDVEWSTCSACGNKATSPAEYCRHLPALKGKKIRKRNPATGKVEEKLIHEVCAGLSFFENSLLVEEPADPTAYVVGDVDTRGLSKAASRRAASLSGPHPGHLQTGDRSACRQNCTYGGTTCRHCGDEVRINLHKTEINGGWHHFDGLKRDHEVTPADPQGVMDSIPGQIARKDQVRQQVRDHLHSQFEQLSGGPLPQRPRGDEGQMPPDPFLASRRTAGGIPPQFREKFTHCSNCGVPLLDPDDMSAQNSPGDWVHHGYPHLCMQCAIGPLSDPPMEGTPGKPHPVFPGNKGGYHNRPSLSGDPLFTDELPEGYRGWRPGDGVRQSTSARTAAAPKKGGDHPFFHANPVSSGNIVAAYHETTPDEKTLGDRWYADAHHVAKAISGGDAAKGAGVLSAYSPRTAWPVNMFNASRAFQGDPPGPGSGAMGMHQKPAMRILAGEHHSKVLKAPKTAAFAHLIEHGGDTPEDERNGTHKVVIDRHAMSVAMGRRIRKDDDAPLGDSQHYEHVAKAYRVAAHVLSEHYGRKISPHQVQAATWLGQIRKNQAEDSSGSEGGGGKGRVQMHENARGKWQQHHREHHHEPHHVPPENMHYHGARRLDPEGIARLVAGARMEDHWPRRVAYGETRVPPQVDTLRMEECPVCGEHDVWSGDRCPVCGFIVPPSLFRDPDTSKAQQVRDELDQSGEVITQPGASGDPSAQQQIGSGEDADDQLMHPDQIAPDGTPGVQGPAGGQPQDAGMPLGGQEEKAEGEQLEEEGEEDQEQGTGEAEEGQELEQQGEEDQLAGPQPDLECPACGAAYSTDVGAQPGTPCPACRQGSLQPVGGPQKDQEGPGAEEEDEGEEMPATRTAAAIAQAQALRIAQLTAENEALAAQLSFLARAAGVDRQLAQIRTAVLRRHADMLNPASPVPDPPQAPAPESTEQALQPAAMDDPSRPGTTPGANAHVPAAMTTTSITPGVEMQTAPASQLVDVTAPVQGTNPSQDGGVPIPQRRIETDVRIDPDPLKAHGPGIGGQGNNGAAFPWLLDAQQPQQQGQQPGQRTGAMPGEAEASRRTFASIRLAKLRITAGLAQGEELAVAERIEKDAGLPTVMIEHEIGVLSRIPQAAPRPMQRAAARQAPSLASVGASAAYAPAAYYDDLDGSDLFD